MYIGEVVSLDYTEYMYDNTVHTVVYNSGGFEEHCRDDVLQADCIMKYMEWACKFH